MQKLKINISFIAALLFALAFAYVFFNFMLVLSEAVRLMSITSLHQIWTFDPADVFLYRLFCALVSLIFGQTLFLRIWLFRLRQPGEKRCFRNTSIQIDLFGLNAFFIHWFSRMALIYAATFGTCFLYLSGNSGFIAEFRWLFVLAPIVLFLQNWTTIRRTYFKRSLRWMLVSALIILLSSFAFTQICLVKSEFHTQLVLSKNPDHVFNIEYPVTNTTDGYIPASMITDLYLLSSEQDSMPWIYANDSLYRYKDLYSIVYKAIGDDDDYYFNQPVFRLHIDRRTKMKWVYRLKDDLSCFGVIRLAFVVSDSFSSGRNVGVIKMGISPRRCDKMPQPLSIFLHEDTSLISNRIHISIFENNNYFRLDSIVVAADSLRHEFYQRIRNNQDCIAILNRNADQSLESYLNLYIQFRAAVYQLKNEESIRCFNAKFDELKENESRLIQKKYPLRWYEIP
ncbi:hypothetical protein SDC9_54171 [bioreactor metagenome]|uniref:Uncharacterized protein n=1 Tax=bioreactor metagenome TaxID=1076179 RepID=A0A644WVM7_9ZZZZ